MTDADRQLVELLAISRKELRDFEKLSAQEKKAVATRDLQRLGIIGRNGRLTPAFR